MAIGKLDSESAVNTVAFTDGGKSVAGYCADGKVRVWDAATGALQKTIAKEELKPPYTALVTGLSQFNGGALQATSKIPNRQTSENLVTVRDAAGAEKFNVQAGIGGISLLGFSPDGVALVAGSYDADLRVWNVRNGELVRRVEELPVSMFTMSFSPDGKLLATAGADRIVYLWDTKTWKLERKISGQPEMISSVAFSADGKRLVTGGFSELTQAAPVKIILWDAASGKMLKSFEAPRRVSSTAFSPDGKRIAAAFRDKTVQLFAAD
ncbi:MAG TPA: hypothetical protein VFB63_24805 [Bryobacteraceae bacterium]|nr:hypothetical protein [Bryobacteraceae bacterium]